MLIEAKNISQFKNLQQKLKSSRYVQQNFFLKRPAAFDVHTARFYTVQRQEQSDCARTCHSLHGLRFLSLLRVMAETPTGHVG
jgi:hypothetical protein